MICIFLFAFIFSNGRLKVGLSAAKSQLFFHLKTEICITPPKNITDCKLQTLYNVSSWGWWEINWEWRGSYCTFQGVSTHWPATSPPPRGPRSLGSAEMAATAFEGVLPSLLLCFYIQYLHRNSLSLFFPIWGRYLSNSSAIEQNYQRNLGGTLRQKESKRRQTEEREKREKKRVKKRKRKKEEGEWEKRRRNKISSQPGKG